MRRNLAYGVIGVVVLFGVGALSLWWLISAVRDHRSTDGSSRTVRVTGVVVSRGGTVLSTATGLSACEQASLQADESDAQVRVTLTVVEPPAGTFCQLSVVAPVTTTTLSAPVGSRKLVDRDGTAVASIDLDRLLPVPHSLGSGVLALGGGIAVQRTTDGIVVDEATAPIAPSGSRVGTFAVGGHRADVYGGSGETTIQWRDGATYVSVRGAPAAAVRRVALGTYP